MTLQPLVERLRPSRMLMPNNDLDQPFSGRVIAVPETRQLDVLASLLETRGATVVRCPLVAIKDAPNPTVVAEWLKRLIADPPHLIVFYTGEGIERLLGVAERSGIREPFVAALRATRKLCRGPKPKRALRRLGLEAEIDALEPTTAGVIATLEPLDIGGQRIAVQLYGDKRIPELEEYLAARGARPDWVAPYVYASAADDARVAELIEKLDGGAIDAIAFTSQSQVERLLKLAHDRGLEKQLATGLKKTFVAAIGPVVAATLRAAGVTVDAMPDDAYFMKPLVTALAERLPEQRSS
jgi:uroporphyrinogen-III synthase